MADNLKQIREKLGINASVPDSTIRELMGTKAGRKEIAKVEGQTKSQAESKLHPGEPNIPALGGVENWLQSNIYSPIGQAVTHPVEAMTAGFSGHEGHSAPPTEAAPKKAKAKETAKLPTPTQATESPFTQLAQQLAGVYLQQVQQLQQLTSGAATPGLEAEAQGGAEAALKGLGVGSAGQQFVANQPTVPLAGEVGAAQKALGNAQAAGGLGVAGAIGAMGPAEAETLAAAPWSTLLNELVSTSAYRASSPNYGPSALGLTTANTPAWLQTALKNSGLNVAPPGTAAGGASGLTAPGTAPANKSTSTALGTGTSQTG